MTNPKENRDPREIEALRMEAEKDFDAEITTMAEGLLEIGSLRTVDLEQVKKYLIESDGEFVEGLADFNLQDQGRELLLEIFSRGMMMITLNTRQQLDEFNNYLDHKLQGRFNSRQGHAKYGALPTYDIKELVAEIRVVGLLARYYNSKDSEVFLKESIALAQAHHALELEQPIPDQAAVIIGEEKIEGIKYALEDANRVNNELRLQESPEKQKQLLEYFASEDVDSERGEFEQKKEGYVKLMSKYADIDELVRQIIGSKNGRLPV